MARLRATAHPVRLRIMSLLTAQAMSAAEVARELDLTHANASYHLRVLHDVGELVVESEEKIRGGTAKRYRYDAGARAPRPHAAPVDDRIAYARANASRSSGGCATRHEGGGSSSDLEAWVPLEAWRRALDLLHEASHLLHAEARPRRDPDTVHVSATAQRLHDGRRAHRRGRSLRSPQAGDLGRRARAPAQAQLRVVLRLALRQHARQHDGHHRADLRRARHHRLAHALGQVLAAHTIPMVALLLCGGVIADRFPRTLVLQFSNVASAISQGAIACLVLAGTPSSGCWSCSPSCTARSPAIGFPAMASVLPQLVPRDRPAAGQRADVADPQRHDGARPDRRRPAGRHGRLRAGRWPSTPPRGCSPRSPAAR